jgi:hypothetical protein
MGLVSWKGEKRRHAANGAASVKSLLQGKHNPCLLKPDRSVAGPAAMGSFQDMQKPGIAHGNSWLFFIRSAVRLSS